jgi:DivIVA domain-containing protein
MWLWVVGIVAVVGAVTVVAVGSGASLSEVYEDRPDRTIPVGRPLRSDDLQEVTFTTAVRGYRMDEVDALLARVRADLLAREAHEPALNAAGAEPGAAEPQGDDRAFAQREARDPGDDVEAAEPEAGEPGANDRALSEREAGQPGAGDHELAERGAREPDADDPEAAEPGAG